MLQELWLYPDKLSYLSNLSSLFSSYCWSSMTLDDTLIRGWRPSGFGIMWRAILALGQIVKFDNKRIYNIFRIDKKRLYFIVSMYLFIL